MSQYGEGLIWKALYWYRDQPSAIFPPFHVYTGPFILLMGKGNDANFYAIHAQIGAVWRESRQFQNVTSGGITFYICIPLAEDCSLTLTPKPMKKSSENWYHLKKSISSPLKNSMEWANYVHRPIVSHPRKSAGRFTDKPKTLRATVVIEH